MRYQSNCGLENDPNENLSNAGVNENQLVGDIIDITPGERDSIVYIDFGDKKTHIIKAKKY